MVRAGELGGILDEVFNRLAGFLEKDFNLKKKVKSAMTYPMVILVMAVVIVFFLVTFILPTFVSLFVGMNMKLPLPTKILITFTEGARNPVVVGITLAVLIGGFFLFKRWTSTQTGRYQYDKFKLKLPVFGMLIRKVAISRFCRTLGALLQSGVPIMQALEIVGKASGNEVIAETVTKVRESVREGESIAVPLNLSGLFPPLVTQMVAVGEETGNLDGMLSKIADFYDVEVEYMLASLTSLLEPLLDLGDGLRGRLHRHLGLPAAVPDHRQHQVGHMATQAVQAQASDTEFEAYAQSRALELRDRLVLAHMGLVRSIVAHYAPNQDEGQSRRPRTGRLRRTHQGGRAL